MTPRTAGSFLQPGSDTADEVARGASILTDVEFSHNGRGLYAISDGIYSGDPEGSPGLPDTGSLVKVDHHGGRDVVAGHLDRPSRSSSSTARPTSSPTTARSGSSPVDPGSGP